MIAQVPLLFLGFVIGVVTAMCVVSLVSKFNAVMVGTGKMEFVWTDTGSIETVTVHFFETPFGRRAKCYATTERGQWWNVEKRAQPYVDSWKATGNLPSWALESHSSSPQRKVEPPVLCGWYAASGACVFLTIATLFALQSV